MLDPERWKQAFFDYSTSSFAEILHRAAPHLLPGRSEGGTDEGGVPSVPHGTTVLALRYRDGVIMAGERQASEGYQVAHRRTEKDHQQRAPAGRPVARRLRSSGRIRVVLGHARSCWLVSWRDKI